MTAKEQESAALREEAEKRANDRAHLQARASKLLADGNTVSEIAVAMGLTYSRAAKLLAEAAAARQRK